MKPKFEWSEDKIRFYKDASRYTHYFENLVDIIKPHIDSDDVVADIGCGIGEFSIAISPLVKKVYAVDMSEEAIEALDSELESRSDIDNITVLKDDITKMDNISWDIGLMSFFGHPGDSLIELIKKAKKRTFIILKDDPKPHEKNTHTKAKGKPYASAIEIFLNDSRLTYYKELHKLDFGQPFRSLDDVEVYKSLYSRSDESLKHIEKSIVKTGDPTFPYYLSKENDAVFFRIENQ